MGIIQDITTNHLMCNVHTAKRKALLDCFPQLSSCPHQHYLALGKYLDSSPASFYSEEIQKSLLSWLENRDTSNRSELSKYIQNNEPELSRAFLFLEDINSLDWHDNHDKLSDYELIRFIDRYVHPTYLKLVEAVFTPFLRPVAFFSRIDRSAGVDGLDTWNIVQEIQKTNVANISKPYVHIVRNGIAHGGITYLQHEILYRDKKGNEEKFDNSEIIRVCDDLLDYCNAMALAYWLFILVHQNDGYCIPEQISIEEYQVETNTPWWRIEGCTPSEFTGTKQLIIYAHLDTYDYGKVQISTFQSGILAEVFLPGYDRYFFSFRSRKAWPGWAAFNGKKLKQLRDKSEVNLGDYADVIEDKLVFFIPRIKLPLLLAKVNTYIQSFWIHWRLSQLEIQNQLGRPRIDVRNVSIHRNGLRSVLNADIVISIHNRDIDKEIIRNYCRRIVRMTLSTARRRKRLIEATRYLPLGFARISIFRKDYRRRRLASFGLEADLIGTIQVKNIKRIRSPDLFESTIEEKGMYRIAWNKSWLER